MGFNQKWKPSRTARKEFAEQMNEIDEFCRQNGISQSSSSDSYYFTINEQAYRVSNHSVEASNAAAYIDGVKVRDVYHEGGRSADVIYIHASKLRIIQIYNDVKLIISTTCTRQNKSNIDGKNS